MAKITIEGYEQYDFCGGEALNESDVELTFDDDCGSKNIMLTLENYVADPDATICISKAELLKVLNFCKEN